MKILLVITDYGSFNNFLSELSLFLTEKGVTVDVICSKEKVIKSDDKYDFKQNKIKFHFIDLPRGYNIIKQLRASKQVHEIIKSVNPDLIHLHFTTAIFTTLLLKRPINYTIGTFHGLGFNVLKPGVKRSIFKFVENFCFKRLDQIWLLNKFDYDTVFRSYPAKAHMYKSLGLGCDGDKFNPENISITEIASIKDRLNILADDLVLSFTGRFVEFKGFALVIKAFLKIYEKKKNVRLILMGGFDPIHPSGLTDHEMDTINTCAGIIKIGFTNKIEKYLAISNLFVFPSIKEGMPVCVIEALMMGIPVVTLDTRGCSDLIKQNWNGILLDDRITPEQLAARIDQLLENPLLVNELKSNILKERLKYDRRNYVLEQWNIYKEIINHSAKEII